MFCLCLFICVYGCVLIHCLFYTMNLRLYFFFGGGGVIHLCLRVRFNILSVLLQAATKTLARE